MKGYVAIPCPDCYTELVTFRMKVNDDGTFTVITDCHKCKLTIHLVVTFTDLHDLSNGKDVYFRMKDSSEKEATAPEPKYTM